MYQQVTIVGNVGRDPELKYMPNGRPVANFTVATNERWTDKQTNERKEKTTWWRVAVWGPQAETVSQYVSKGRQVMVIGTVEARAYLDQSGQPQASLELTARDVRFLGGRDGDVQGQPMD
ncbi:MAG TPA: single-stranded DNA-binding protein, partial [Oceanobacillus sp.]|nr:single-stranded DNA-binding protein [Oceanobacillus sp.]